MKVFKSFRELVKAIEYVNPQFLKPHPMNSELFDDITGDDWEEFKADIKENGILHPITVTVDYVIISGAQRWRAALEVGMELVPVITYRYPRDYEELGCVEDRVIMDLIRANTLQRFKPSDSAMKMARRLAEVQRICGMSNGRPKQSEYGEKNVSAADTFSSTYCEGEPLRPMSKEEIAALEGISTSRMRELLKLVELVPELQDAVDSREIGPEIGVKILSRLSKDGQKRLLEGVGMDVLKQYTVKELKDVFPQLKALDEERQQEIQQKEAALADMKERLDRSQKKPAFEESEYDKLAAENERLHQNERDLYEKLQFEKKIHDKEKSDLKKHYDKKRQAEITVQKHLAALDRIKTDLQNIGRLDDSELMKLEADLRLVIETVNSIGDRLPA